MVETVNDLGSSQFYSRSEKHYTNRARTRDVDTTSVVLPEVCSGGLVDTSDETLETLLRTVVTGHRLI